MYGTVRQGAYVDVVVVMRGVLVVRHTPFGGRRPLGAVLKWCVHGSFFFSSVRFDASDADALILAAEPTRQGMPEGFPLVKRETTTTPRTRRAGVARVKDR